jgi:hypothetical protein
MRTKVGLVFYEDDPEHVFRIVYPLHDDAELFEDVKKWTTLGCDPRRRALMRIVTADDPTIRMTGTP